MWMLTHAISMGSLVCICFGPWVNQALCVGMDCTRKKKQHSTHHIHVIQLVN